MYSRVASVIEWVRRNTADGEFCADKVTILFVAGGVVVVVVLFFFILLLLLLSFVFGIQLRT